MECHATVRQLTEGLGIGQGWEGREGERQGRMSRLQRFRIGLQRGKKQQTNQACLGDLFF